MPRSLARQRRQGPPPPLMRPPTWGGAPSGPVTWKAFFFPSSPTTRSNSTSSPSFRLRNPLVSMLLCAHAWRRHRMGPVRRAQARRAGQLAAPSPARMAHLVDEYLILRVGSLDKAEACRPYRHGYPAQWLPKQPRKPLPAPLLLSIRTFGAGEPLHRAPAPFSGVFLQQTATCELLAARLATNGTQWLFKCHSTCSGSLIGEEVEGQGGPRS